MIDTTSARNALFLRLSAITRQISDWYYHTRARTQHESEERVAHVEFQVRLVIQHHRLGPDSFRPILELHGRNTGAMLSQIDESNETRVLNVQRAMTLIFNTSPPDLARLSDEVERSDQDESNRYEALRTLINIRFIKALDAFAYIEGVQCK